MTMSDDLTQRLDIRLIINNSDQIMNVACKDGRVLYECELRS